jgi:hypothetical protein
MRARLGLVPRQPRRRVLVQLGLAGRDDFLDRRQRGDVTRRAALLPIDDQSGHAAWALAIGRTRDYVMLPGMKQRIEVPSEPFIGQTIVRPDLFGSVITASSGTSIHSWSRRTR